MDRQRQQQKRQRRCKNCKVTFKSGAGPNEPRLEFTQLYNIYSCSECGAVNSFKKYIYNLAITSPPLIELLKKYVGIKKHVNLIKLEEIFNRFCAIVADNGEIAQLVTEAAQKVNMGPIELVDLLIREHRFNKKKTENHHSELISKLDSLGFFKFVSEQRPAMPKAIQVVEKQISMNPLFLQQVFGKEEDIVDFKSGHYNGSSGNCAKKVATRIWRALRFLSECNKLVQAYFPDTGYVLDMDYNKDLNVPDLIKRVMPVSREKVEKLLAGARSPELDRFFCVSITRKETKYCTPMVEKLVPSKKGGGGCETVVNTKMVRKKKSRKLMLEDFLKNDYEFQRLKPKNFEYLAVMNVQNSDKVADILKKMGTCIWLANVYTLNMAKPTNEERPKKVATGAGKKAKKRKCSITLKRSKKNE